MKPPVIDGVTYDKEFVGSLRETCITLRDAALGAGRMDWAVALSHVIAFISVAAEEMKI